LRFCRAFGFDVRCFARQALVFDMSFFSSAKIGKRTAPSLQLAAPSRPHHQSAGVSRFR
jgi:hypothetical protein